MSELISQIPEARDYITVPEAVAMFGISRDTIYRLIRKGTIPCVNLGERLTRISNGENLGSGFPLILSAWNEKHWLKLELIEQLDLMQVKLILHIENIGDNPKNDPKENDVLKNVPKDVLKKISDRQRLVLEALAADASLFAKAISEKTSERISEKVSVSDRTIETDLAQLKKLGILSREGGRKEGKWIIKTDE